MKILLLFERILLLKQRNRSKAAKAATGSTPCLKSGACAPLFGQVSRLRNGNLSQRNYIKIVRGLPQAARKEYLAKVFDLKLDDI
jgi:hypothetical protein